MADRFRWDDFLLDLDAYRLERRGAPVALEPKALDLLALMVRRPGHLFTKQEIFDAVWPDTAVTDHALTRIVAQVRRALGDEAREAKYLETVPTRGYRWIGEVIVDDSPKGLGETSPVPTDPATPPGRDRRPLRLVAISAGVVAVVAMATLSVWRPGSQSAQSGYGEGRPASTTSGDHDVEWPQQVTTSSGLDLHPALSPLGDSVAFASDRSGAFEIYVRALDGTPADVPLTSDGGENVQAAWSPDGRLIAYHSNRLGGIWVIPSRGGTPRQIAADGSKPAWSPDGTAVAYQSDENADIAPTGFGAQVGSTIRLVGADGTGDIALTRSGDPGGGHAAPAWSPDGRFVTFTVFEAGSRNGLWLLDRRTGSTSLLQSGSFFESSFSPDGSTIYVAGGAAYVVRQPFDPATGRLDGPRTVIPVPGVPGVRGLSVSPDGSRIAFAGLALDSQIWAQPVRPDGTPTAPASPLTRDTSRRNTLPAVSPDGTKVAYASTRAGERPDVWIVDVATGEARQLTDSPDADGFPVWAPDGRSIVFRSSRNGGGFWSIDIATRVERQLIDDLTIAGSDEANAPARLIADVRLSGSLARIAFSLYTPPEGRRRLFVSALEPFLPRPLGNEPLSTGYSAWSPDERSIAVEIKDGISVHAGVIDVETGAIRRLTSERGQTWVRSWSPDGRKVAAAVLREGRWSLRWIAADGSGEGVLTPPGPSRVYVRYPDWSRRGDLVVFERAEMTGNIWTLRLR